MIDVEFINRALMDTLRQVAPGDFRYLIIMWDSDDRAAVSSNEMDVGLVKQMLAGATVLVNETPAVAFSGDEPVSGTA